MTTFGGLTVISRSTWHAEDPNGTRTRRDPSSLHTVVFHWPGESPRSWRNVNTPAEERAVVREFQRFHIHDHGWTDIGYNHVMGNAGEIPRVYTARGAQYTPAAQQNWNTGTIACCILLGPDDHLPEALIRRMRSYVRACERYAGHNLKVTGHGLAPHQSTECPGPAIRAALAKVRV